jgi:NAD(P)-dependent dehydrogenase (short-subunit alcohol dehydrogenase family)
MGRLDSKVAIVIGAGGGLGARTAEMMAEEGAQVVVGDIHKAGAQAVAERINGAGGDAIGLGCDVSDEASVKALVAAAMTTFGRIDVLHNNAAWLDPANSAESSMTVVDIPLADWDRTFAVNLRGPLLTFREVVPIMLKQGSGGSLILTSSTLGLAGEQVRGAYSSSKAGMLGLMYHMATAYGPNGIRCNAICPGLIVAHPEVEFPAAILAMHQRHHPSPRVGENNDIAYTATFLASDESAFINGVALRVDGGLLAHIPQMADTREDQSLTIQSSATPAAS